ncbi:hypothetical protein RRG08_051597 [Elysia crispata]|uniref:Uncharacterized protein n=1 Tax=Elysia crispata TaxID=231223 RepID=A0AAE1DRF1_9GAST|nr:hypothetical protein RRG08_051597 [Elysia crispata]
MKGKKILKTTNTKKNIVMECVLRLNIFRRGPGSPLVSVCALRCLCVPTRCTRRKISLTKQSSRVYLPNVIYYGIW